MQKCCQFIRISLSFHMWKTMIANVRQLAAYRSTRTLIQGTSHADNIKMYMYMYIYICFKVIKTHLYLPAAFLFPYMHSVFHPIYFLSSHVSPDQHSYWALSALSIGNPVSTKGCNHNHPSALPQTGGDLHVWMCCFPPFHIG